MLLTPFAKTLQGELKSRQFINFYFPENHLFVFKQLLHLQRENKKNTPWNQNASLTCLTGFSAYT
ncbi:MAG: hypothetical protein EA361_14490, partial [Bacteroidetes bacterium]